jgi:hypothetical protein
VPKAFENFPNNLLKMHLNFLFFAKIIFVYPNDTISFFVLQYLYFFQPPVTYASDHVYPGPGGEGVPVVVLYAQLGTQEFNQAHQQMVQLADSGKASTGTALPW